MKMNIINLTPHVLTIFDEEDNLVMEVAPSGRIARIATRKVLVDRASGIPLFRTTMGDPEGLPKQDEKTIYIVSGMFRSHVQRDDLYQPGELVRNDEGQPIGCIGLSQ